MKKHFILGLVVALAGPFASGDTLTVGETVYEEVLVRETPRMFYVQLPATGEVIHVRKDSEPAPVLEEAAPEERAALQALWRESRHREGLRPVHPEQASPRPDTTAAASEAENPNPMLRLRGELSRQQQAGAQNNPERVSGNVPYVRLQNVSLEQALAAILRPMGLDYEVRNNVVFISTPQTLRRESWERIETRVYEVASAYDTLPKIVVRNPFGQVGGFGGGMGGGMQQGFGGGMGGVGGMQQGIGQQGFGGGMGGGMQQGIGQQGFGGGMGGGMGGVGGGMVPDVTQVSNISDLFSNIDDRIVGEAPAIIGGFGLQSLRNRNNGGVRR